MKTLLTRTSLVLIISHYLAYNIDLTNVWSMKLAFPSFRNSSLRSQSPYRTVWYGVLWLFHPRRYFQPLNPLEAVVEYLRCVSLRYCFFMSGDRKQKEAFFISTVRRDKRGYKRSAKFLIHPSSSSEKLNEYMSHWFYYMDKYLWRNAAKNTRCSWDWGNFVELLNSKITIYSRVYYSNNKWQTAIVSALICCRFIDN